MEKPGIELWEEDSPNVILIKRHFRDYAIDEWDNARVGRLCQAMVCTVYELCALAGIFNKRQVQSMWNKGKWPAPVVLHFARIERFNAERLFGTPSGPDPFDVQSAILLNRADEVKRDG